MFINPFWLDNRKNIYSTNKLIYNHQNTGNNNTKEAIQETIIQKLAELSDEKQHNTLKSIKQKELEELQKILLDKGPNIKKINKQVNNQQTQMNKVNQHKNSQKMEKRTKLITSLWMKKQLKQNK